MVDDYKDTPDMVRKKLAPVASKYSETPELKAAVAAIPYAGEIIDAYLSGLATYSTHRNIEKLTKLANYLEEEISRLDEGEVDLEYFKTEEFHDLFFLILSKTNRVIRDNKFRYFARLLTRGCVVNEDSRPNRTEDFVEIIDSLTTEEMKLMFIVQEYFKANPTFRTFGEGTVKEFIESRAELEPYSIAFSKELIVAYATKMERFGLWFDISGTFMTSKDYPNNSEFQRTPLLDELIEYVREFNEDE